MTKYPGDTGYQAYRILQVTFIIAPIIAGLDKFIEFLVRWVAYLPPIVLRMLPMEPRLFMMIVGVIEIVAGIGVALKPKIFAYVVAAWLLIIIINLLLTGMYYDIALRDLGLFLSALALGRLSQKYAP